MPELLKAMDLVSSPNSARWGWFGAWESFGGLQGVFGLLGILGLLILEGAVARFLDVGFLRSRATRGF